MGQYYTQTVFVKSTAKRAFQALTNKIDLWWGSVDNMVEKKGDRFTITFGEAYWTFEIVTYQPNKKVSWKVIDGQPELNNEWLGHLLEWTIIEVDDKIEVTLYQHGLSEELPCFEVCSAAWDRFILSSLKLYLETGVGNPAII